MPFLTISHVTAYRYRAPVAFGEHRIMVRPRESHDQRLWRGAPASFVGMDVSVGITLDPADDSSGTDDGGRSLGLRQETFTAC